MSRLKDKVAIITGGNSGIGKGIAKQFISEGAKVAILGRNAETLKQAEEEMPGILAIRGDVTQADDLKSLYNKTMNNFGKIDILVANSGVAERLSIQQVDEKAFDWMVDINYRGAFFTVKYALDSLNDGASVILISSCAASITVLNHSVYSSSKAAVVKLAQNLSRDLAGRGMRVNSISPGFIETPIFEKVLRDDPSFLERRASMIPLNRIGKPQDIAHAALFLATDEASYITGIDLRVDGGICETFSE